MENDRLLILVSNDDGVHADGLVALYSELKKIGDVTVVAPDRERSAAGHSLTFFSPLRATKIKQEKHLTVYSSDGTPSDCVVLGIYDLLPRKPDIVVSGINRGANMGDDVSYSGTVSAALEGLIHGVPSIALSLAAFEDTDFSFAATLARKLVKAVMKYGLPPKVCLNVNLPNVPAAEIQGIEITSQGESIYDQRLLKRIDPRGGAYYWVAGAIPSGEPDEGTDFAAVFSNKVSITPIHMKMTDFRLMEKLRSWKIL